ncbi:MAG TPA: hypothetical protein ENN03_03390 [bacterium]|nr:hypothetical protein [bacterium]
MINTRLTGRWFIQAAGIGLIVLMNMLHGDDMDRYAIRSRHIHTVTRGKVDGVVLIQDGIIQAVGTNINIPAGYEIIEADTLRVYPGFIDAHGSIGLKAPESAGAAGNGSLRIPLSDAHIRAAGLLDRDHQSIDKMRNQGVTTVLTIPPRGVFIGQSTLINLAGADARSMVVKSPVGLHMGYDRQPGQYPNTLMAVIAFQRQTFLDALHHQRLLRQYEQQKRGIRRPTVNEPLEAIFPVFDGIRPLIIQVNTENEIKRALKLAAEFNLQPILSGVNEGWRVVDRLREANLPAIMTVNYPKPEEVTGYAWLLETDPLPGGAGKTAETRKDTIRKEQKPWVDVYANGAALNEAGVLHGFGSWGTSGSDFLKNIRKAVEHGLPANAALESMTIRPAKLLGVAEQLGSIEAGKIANLVIMNREWHDKEALPRFVFIDGEKFRIEESKKTPAKAEVDVTGRWDCKAVTPDGEQPFTLILSQKEETLTGRMVSPMGEVEIRNGVVSGNTLDFTVSLPLGPQPVDLYFTGTVTGNTVKGTLDMGPMGQAGWSGEKPGMEFNIRNESTAIFGGIHE